MGMTVNQHIGVVTLRQLRRGRASDFVTMTHVHADSADGQHDLRLETGKIRWIRIAENRAHGSYESQLIENLPPAHISRVQDQLNTGKGIVYGTSHESVGVRDQANDMSVD
jgi:hypothetical protein